MTTVEILIIAFLFFIFFIPNRIGATPATSTACDDYSCTFNSPPIRFPFRLIDYQPSQCGFSEGFDLSCHPHQNGQITILTLPNSGHFIVQLIDYRGQNVWITDPENCFARRFLDHNFSLDSSPFSNVNAFLNFTFLNCSSEAEVDYPPISCLSTEIYLVTAVPSDQISEPPSLCYVMSTALIPLNDPAQWDPLNYFGLQLGWKVPDCHFCDQLGEVCGSDHKNGTSSELTCSSISSGPSPNGFSRSGKYVVLISIGITWLFIFLFVLGVRLSACGPVEQRSAVVELSSIANAQPPVGVMGLDDSTIKSYPLTQLGESWELPKSNDNTCPICLGKYKPKETLRSIPECKHFFHANCIDEWLRRNATCPICRNPSEGNKISSAGVNIDT